MPDPAVLVQPQTDLLDRAGRYLAGGGLGLFVLPDEGNLVIAEGHGSHITDISGRDFIDYHLGSGPALLGHAHPEVVAAVQRQLPKGSTYYFLNEPVIRLAEKMAEADSVGIPEALRGQVLVAPFNDAQLAVQIIEQHANELAAVIVEPLQRVL